MSSIALVKDDRYLEHNPGAGHPESPNRLLVIHDLIEKEFRHLPLIPPRLATENELALVHDPFYIQRVASTAGMAHAHLDADTGLSARSYEIARLAAGGLLAALDALLGNPKSEIRNPQSVFAFVRPPGHHAEADRGMGFCLFNNVAIAAEYAKEHYGLKRILIIDWDLHHGNGTQHSFSGDHHVLFFSSHQYPHYPGTGDFDEVGSGAGEGFTVNAPFPSGFGDAEYLPVYERIVRPIALEYHPELIIVSAGFDPSARDPLGGMRVSAEGFGALAAIVRDLAGATCSGRVLLSLEGGYHPEGLRDGVRAVLQAFLEPAPASPPREANPPAAAVINKITAIHKKYWKSLR